MRDRRAVRTGSPSTDTMRIRVSGARRAIRTSSNASRSRSSMSRRRSTSAAPGPPVIVMAEMPGISPHVARFARWVWAAGVTVYLPTVTVYLPPLFGARRR